MATTTPDLYSADLDTVLRIAEGTRMFFEQVGALCPVCGEPHAHLCVRVGEDDEYEYPDEPADICPVCQWDSTREGVRRPCSAECYQSWKGYSDPREYEVGYGG